MSENSLLKYSKIPSNALLEITLFTSIVLLQDIVDHNNSCIFVKVGIWTELLVAVLCNEIIHRKSIVSHFILYTLLLVIGDELALDNVLVIRHDI